VKCYAQTDLPMASVLLDQLRKIALRISIEPEDGLDKAASVLKVVRVLTQVRTSFLGYVEVEFFRVPSFREVFEKNSSVLDQVKRDLELFVVDVEFGSLESALAPDIVSKGATLFTDDVLEWKREKFHAYKQDVFLVDYDNPAFVRDITARYNGPERTKIYRPIFKALGGDQKTIIRVLDQNKKSLNVLHLPDEPRQLQLAPLLAKPEKVLEEKNVVGYFKIKTDGKIFDLKKKNVMQIYDIEPLEHDIYPFKPDTIRSEGHSYLLTRKLQCTVEFEDGLYYISFPDLAITVWGKTREEVEEAFNFTFHSLYENYVTEPRENLSPGAIEIREKIEGLVKAKYYHKLHT
jgi:hypothetical protein